MAWTAAGLAVAVAAGCRPKVGGSAVLADPIQNNTQPLHDIPLVEFGYDVKPDAYAEIGSRVGCQVVVADMAYPTSGSLTGTIADLMKSAYFYRDQRTKLEDPATLTKLCAQDGGTDSQAGVKKLVQAAGDGGLTIVLVGGLGGAQATDGILAESRKLWEANDQGGKLSVVRADCQASYSTVATCAAAVGQKLTQMVTDTPQRKLLLWAHGQGGAFLLEALAKLPVVRDKTLAVVTVSSPLGGAAAQTVYVSELKAAANLAQSLAGQSLPGFGNDPVQTLMTPLEAIGSPAFVTQVLGTQAQEVATANAEMHPALRSKYLAALLGSTDFTKPSGGALPVFHVASALDMTHLSPLPLLTMNNGSVGVATDRMNPSHLLLFLGLTAFADYPMCDGAVALEHAVLPANMKAKGLAPQLLALFAVDHMSMTFSSVNQRGAVLPNAGIVDGLLSTVADSLQRGAQ